MWKLVYKDHKRSPSGGDPNHWVERNFKLFSSDLSAEDLENKVKEFLSTTNCGYSRKVYISLNKL